jgi:hypothetical protein
MIPKQRRKPLPCGMRLSRSISNPGRQKHEINVSEVIPELEFSGSVSTTMEWNNGKKAGETPSTRTDQ